MQFIGNVIVYILMICLLLGCVGAVINPSKGIGFEFCEGIRQLGTIFIPVAGVMAALPYLRVFVETVFLKLANMMGHDLAIWAGMILPPDMGGNILANSLASGFETWIIALFVAFILGTGVTFGIPLSIAMVEKRDHKYMALGILCGLMACPVGITVSCVLCMYTHPMIRPAVSTALAATQPLFLTWPVILVNLLPVYLLCLIIAVGIWLAPQKAIKCFLLFGNLLNCVLYVVFALAVVEYFTGLGSLLWPGWEFYPIVADAADSNRALETAGYCAMMLGGAYPMMYLLQKYCGSAIAKLGNQLGITSVGCLGIIASSVTLVAMFRAYGKMPPLDKVRSAAWAICSGYFLADHLVYCYNFQPTLYGCLLAGKIAGGILAMILVSLLVKKTVANMETADRDSGLIAGDAYMEYEMELTRRNGGERNQ